MVDKKLEFKRLFFTDLTETELRNILGVSRKEYQSLLKETKKELGLPSSFRRNPNRWDKYNSDSFYIIHYIDDDFEIVTYRPTLESAEYELEKILSESVLGLFDIKKASDDNMKKLIHKEYFVKGNNWENIISKVKMPYYKFYQLLNQLKKEKNNEVYSKLQ